MEPWVKLVRADLGLGNDMMTHRGYKCLCCGATFPNPTDLQVAHDHAKDHFNRGEGISETEGRK